LKVFKRSNNIRKSSWLYDVFTVFGTVIVEETVGDGGGFDGGKAEDSDSGEEFHFLYFFVYNSEERCK
jgi:hypothetical protein